MNIDVEIGKGLQRHMKVVLTNENVRQAVPGQLQLLSLDPEAIAASDDVFQGLEQFFGEKVRDSIVQKLTESSFTQAVRESDFIIAGIPIFGNTEITPDNKLIYNVTFDIYPEVSLPDLSLYRFTQLSAEVKEEDVDRTLSILRRQQAEWCTVDQAAVMGNKVTINCYAKVGERVFDGKEMRVELTDDMLTGFEKDLIGVAAGQKLPIEINFSADHYQADVAGKSVIFDVDVVQIESLVLPELDEDFIRSNGIESGKVEVMRSVIHRNMDMHLQKILRLKNTLTVFSEILKDNPIEVPQSLLNEELERLTCDPCEQVEGVESFKHDIDPAMFTDLAYTRVARSMMVTTLADAREIVLDEDEVKERVDDLVSEYPQKEKIIDWFYDDDIRLAGVKADVLGEQVADLILKEAQVTKVETTYADMTDFGNGV